LAAIAISARCPILIASFLLFIIESIAIFQYFAIYNAWQEFFHLFNVSPIKGLKAMQNIAQHKI
jgi:hypothetical protein